MKSILYCTGYYTKEFCQKKANELREKIKTGDENYSSYGRVAIVDKITDYDTNHNLKQFNRIRLYFK